MRSPRIAILASGSGTTAETFIKSVAERKVEGTVVLLMCNNPEATVFDKVKRLQEEFDLDITAKHIGKSNFPPSANEEVPYGHQTAAEEKAILDELKKMKIDLVLLLGYMKLIGPTIVDQYGWKAEYESVYQAKMINTHPGLLPATKGLFGLHVQEKVLKDGSKSAGHCMFMVDSHYDDGPVISEHIVQVVPGESPEDLFERVKASEKANLADDLNRFILEQAEYLKVKYR